MDMLKEFWEEEDGMGTVEIILIIAVLVAIALLFRNQLIKWVNSVIEKVFPTEDSVPDNKGTQNEKLNQPN